MAAQGYDPNTVITSLVRDEEGEDSDEGGNYICAVCKKGFSRSSNLKRHERIHAGEKRFRCPRCPKSFQEKHHLVAHVRTHTGEKPYKCPHCPKRFTDRSNMLRHVKTHPDANLELAKAVARQQDERASRSAAEFTSPASSTSSLSAAEALPELVPSFVLLTRSPGQPYPPAGRSGGGGLRRAVPRLPEGTSAALGDPGRKPLVFPSSDPSTIPVLLSPPPPAFFADAVPSIGDVTPQLGLLELDSSAGGSSSPRSAPGREILPSPLSFVNMVNSPPFFLAGASPKTSSASTASQLPLPLSPQLSLPPLHSSEAKTTAEASLLSQHGLLPPASHSVKKRKEADSGHSPSTRTAVRRRMDAPMPALPASLSTATLDPADVDHVDRLLGALLLMGPGRHV